MNGCIQRAGVSGGMISGMSARQSSPLQGWPEGLLAHSLEAYRKEYERLWDTWRHLDIKAQGSIAIAGIFLAAAFAFLKDVGSNMTVFETALLSAAVLLVIVTVLLAVLALRIKEVLDGPSGETIHGMAKDLIIACTSQEEQAERLRRFQGDEMKLWCEAIDSLRRVNASKAILVLRGQCAILGLTIAVGLLVMARVICH